MSSQSRADRRFRVTLLIALIIGLAIRWLALRGANWRIDYDEGMVGLQVLRMMRGEFAVFHPGQPYLGNLESYLLLPCFMLFGPNNPTLKLVPLLLSGLYVATTGWLGRSAFDRRTGALAALIAAVAPTYLVVVGLKAWGATIETLVLGNWLLLLMLAILQAGEAGPKRYHWLLFGFVMGLAFWISWLIAFYAIPALLALFWRYRAHFRLLLQRGWITIPAFFVGSLPFWVYNVQHPLATLTFLLGGERSSTLLNAPHVIKNFVVDLAPRLVSGDTAWRVLSGPASWLLVAIYVLGVIALLAARRRADSGLLALFTICFLPVYILSGFGNNALNPYGIDATGRYVLMLHSVLPIGLALLPGVIPRMALSAKSISPLTPGPFPPRKRKERGVKQTNDLASPALLRIRWFAEIPGGQKLRLQLAGLALVVAALTLNLVGVARIDPTPVFTSPYYVDQPATLKPLIDLLDARGITRVWTQVQIAQVLMFETQERILAADYYDRYYAHGLVRFPDVFDKVAAASHVAFATLILPGQNNTPMDRAFTASGIAYERLTPTPRLLVIIPGSPIDPASVLAGLGYQYSGSQPN